MGYIFCTKTNIMNSIIYFRVLTTFLCMHNWHHFSVITGLISLLMPFLLSLKYRSCNPLIHHVKPTLTCLMNVCTFCQMSVLLNNPGGMVNRLLNEFLSGSIVFQLSLILLCWWHETFVVTVHVWHSLLCSLHNSLSHQNGPMLTLCALLHLH